MASYLCDVCGYVFEEEHGDAEGNILPGTRWDDIADDWVCPECGATKAAFIAVE